MRHGISCCLIAAAFAISGCNAPSTSTPSVVSPDPFPQHIDKLFAAIPDEPPADLRSREGQSYMQMLPAVGREDIHAAQENWPMRASPCKAKQSVNSAVDEIVAVAQDTTVVIINEAHDRPRHRDFIRRVATELRPFGYSVFAAETFSKSVATRPPYPYPLMQDGFYSNEPVFGALLRELMGLGFRLEPYEHSIDEKSKQLDVHTRASIREEGQASNLQRIIDSMADGERLLVHVGYSHASEVPIRSFGGKNLTWMAGRLGEKTGIDPVTVDQTDCSVVDGRVSVTEPSFKHEPGQFDIVIGHPVLTFVQRRPSWRQRESIKAVAVPALHRSDTERVIVEVRPLGEPTDSVPIDRLMLWPAEKLPLLLREGNYTVMTYFAASRQSVEGELTVQGQ